MSKTKRMGHVFNEMVVKHGRDIDTAELHFIGGGVSATFFCAQQAHHAAHAINNHDRMADEIAELRAKITKKDEVISGLIEVLGVSVDEASELRGVLDSLCEPAFKYSELVRSAPSLSWLSERVKRDVKKAHDLLNK